MKRIITFLFLTVSSSVVFSQTFSIQRGSSFLTIQQAIDTSVEREILFKSRIHTDQISLAKSITLGGTDHSVDIIQTSDSAVYNGIGCRVITIGEGAFYLNIENLGIRYRNRMDNGGGINIDKVTVLITLNNLIMENNYDVKNGVNLGVA